jgi:hypothetical protein
MSAVVLSKTLLIWQQEQKEEKLKIDRPYLSRATHHPSMTIDNTQHDTEQLAHVS